MRKFFAISAKFCHKYDHEDLGMYGVNFYSIFLMAANTSKNKRMYNLVGTFANVVNTPNVKIEIVIQ